MKKAILGLMLIVGSLSFANNRKDSFSEQLVFDNIKQEQSVDERLNRASQKVEEKGSSEKTYNRKNSFSEQLVFDVIK